MQKSSKPPENIDASLATSPSSVRTLLAKVRATIRKAAPAAQEKISYGIPTFFLHGNLVHFAGFKHHIGFFPTSSGTAKFKHELSGYKGGKGSVQFPLDEPIPYALISRIVKFRVKENCERAAAKLKSRSRA